MHSATYPGYSCAFAYIIHCKSAHKRDIIQQQITQCWDHHQTLTVMHWNTPDGRIKHTCLCCLYKVSCPKPALTSHTQLEGEDDLTPSMIMSIDSNNSLKWLLCPDCEDIQKPFPSNYYLPPKEVDLYKNEVKKRATNTDIQLVSGL